MEAIRCFVSDIEKHKKEYTDIINRVLFKEISHQDRLSLSYLLEEKESHYDVNLYGIDFQYEIFLNLFKKIEAIRCNEYDKCTCPYITAPIPQNELILKKVE